MSARRSGPFLLAALLAAAGCKDVSQHAPPETLVVAVFASPNIPTPNDLVLQAVPTLPASAQRDLLQSLVDQGGFPADQAPTLSVPLRAFTWNGTSNTYEAAADLPTLDPASVTAASAALYKVDVTPPARIDVQAAAAQVAGTASLVPVADSSGSRRLLPGRYVFAVRGGSSGLKTTTGLPISADTAIALTIPNKDLSNPANQPPGGLSPAQVAQLGAVQGVLWNPLTWSPVNTAGTNYWTASVSAAVTPAYAAVDAAFPHAEVVSIAAFQIAPRTGETFAVVDSTSGEAPLPLDLLRTGEGGTIAYNAAFGPAAAGLTTLDGFSTTAMILAPVITPGAAASAIDASTVNGANVFLYELGGASPVLLPELKYELAKGVAGNPASAKYVAQPTPIIVPKGSTCPIDGGCSPVIGLQPAVNTGLGLYLPPLKERTTYAVVITKRVHDPAGASLARSSVMPLLLDPNPLVHPVTGASLVGGVNDTTAAALQRMNDELEPVLAALPTGTTVDDVALAYTFKTQSITPTALSIAALPYSQAGVGTVLSYTTLTPAAAAAQYGLDAAHLQTPPVAEIAEVKLATVSLLLGSQTGGAFDPGHPTPEVITALVAVPSASAVTGACPPGIGAAHCAPLVVYRHGITRSKADLLAVAGALTAQGFVVAAIDGEKHGDRSWCTSDDQCCPAALCGTASTCAFKENFTSPTDGTTQIGVCESAPGVRGSYLNMRIDCASPYQAPGVPNPACLSPKGVPYVSANYLVSMNFFRTRDTLRQDVIDQSALVKALAPTSLSDAFATHLAASGIAVDYTKVYLLSHSLGAIQGAADMAVNPRFSHAVFAAPGATVVDIFANPASAYHPALIELLDPVQENSAEYLQLLQVAKWILDPADPANFGKHVASERLVSPLNGSFPNQSRAGQLLVENALCDPAIPNAQNAYFASQLGLGVAPAGTAGSAYVQWYVNSASTQTCPADGASHSFLFDGANLSLTTKAQATAASFLATPAAQLITVRP